MQAVSHPAQPQSLLAPAVRALVAIPVALFLSTVVSVAAGASHQAVDHMSAQIDAPRHVQLEPVFVAVRRAPAANAAAGCTAARPEAG